MNIEKTDKTALELEIEKKVHKSNNEVKTKKQLLAEAEKTKIKLQEESKEISKKIRKLKFESEKAEANAKRDTDTKLKIHAGGMLEMTGLMRYVYPEGVDTDNPQDRLIANLLVGIILRASEAIKNVSDDELHKIWLLGQDFRKQQKSIRTLPKVNENLKLLFEKLKTSETATIQQPNDNVQPEIPAK